MNIYQMAMVQVKNDLDVMKNDLKKFYDYDVINNINCTILRTIITNIKIPVSK